MSTFDDLDTLFSNDLSVDELLERWTNDTDYITDPINDPLATWTKLLDEETQAICGTIDPTRLAYQPLEPLAAPSPSPVWSNEPLPVPYVPVIEEHSKEQESLFLTPPRSPQTTAGAEDQNKGNGEMYVSSYPELPSLTEGAWPPFAYTQTEATSCAIPIDPALLAEDASSSTQRLSPAPTPASTDPSPSAPRKRKRPTTPLTPPPAPCKRPKHPSPSPAPTPTLPAPLSLLTSTSSIPLKDIPSYISRSPSVRRAEAASKSLTAKHRNKPPIPRPMNSFILYRFAYAERIKEYAGECHQVISKVAGESWGMETAEVRGLFEEFARVEKEGHEATWVGWRYKPGKRGG